MSGPHHVEAICWLRYAKRLPIVCTEVGRWHADVIGLCDTMSIEVEVKTSKSDLLREFTTKKSKHWIYANATDEQDHIPNYFYFILPEALVADVAAIIEEKAPKAGIAAHTETKFLAGNNIQVVRKATRLRKGAPSPRMIRTALARMSSELCGSKQLILECRNKIITRFDEMANGALMIAAGAVGSLDCEDAEINLDLRAAQLAQCVEGKIWSEVQDKDKWREAAKKWLEIQQYQNQLWTDAALRDR